jgi:mono/diheme cytochrome c family protein
MRRFIPTFRNALGVAVCAAALTGCHLDMWNQRRYEPLEKGVSFGAGESSARPFVDGTVPYQMAKLDEHYYTGRVNGEFATTLPSQVALSRELLERGQARFAIYCMPCHGETGQGNGMIVQRGFPAPTNYSDQRLLESPIGYFFDVMSNGFGRMYSYASRVPVDDRWAIAAYVRTLQLSQNATPDLLPPDVLTQARQPQPGQEAGDTAAGGVQQ